jgi:hypothetical protein
METNRQRERYIYINMDMDTSGVFQLEVLVPRGCRLLTAVAVRTSPIGRMTMSMSRPISCLTVRRNPATMSAEKGTQGAGHRPQAEAGTLAAGQKQAGIDNRACTLKGTLAGRVGRVAVRSGVRGHRGDSNELPVSFPQVRQSRVQDVHRLCETMRSVCAAVK